MMATILLGHDFFRKPVPPVQEDFRLAQRIHHSTNKPEHRVVPMPDIDRYVLLHGNQYLPNYRHMLQTSMAENLNHRCRVPCDYIPKRSYPLFRTRQILNDWLTQNLEEA